MYKFSFAKTCKLVASTVTLHQLKSGTSTDRRKRMVSHVQGKVGVHAVLTTSGQPSLITTPAGTPTLPRSGETILKTAHKKFRL